MTKHYLSDSDSGTAMRDESNPFASLPGNLGQRAAALVAKREALGCNVHFINSRGEYDRFSFADAASANRFAAARQREGFTVFADEAARRAHEDAARRASKGF